MAVITFMDDSGSGNRPDQGLPGGGPNYPTTGPLPPGAVTLPVFPFDPTLPDNTLPGSQPGIDNTLPGGGVGGGHPSGQPIVPGRKFVVKWFACQGLILVPDNTLPPTAEPKA
jgi:hypothetical protein